MSYEEIILNLNTITGLTEVQLKALNIAKDCVKKEIPLDVIIDTTHMDENCNDYNYLCPLCSCSIHDENEYTGRCDCGQRINLPNIQSWLEEFEKAYKYSYKTKKWYKRRKKLSKV